MDVASLFDVFWQNLLNTTWLEIVAVFLGMLSVWYARKENILVYPTGIVSVLIYVYICYFAKLYADMGINFFYFLMSVYGWHMWTRKDATASTLEISSSGLRSNIINIFITVAIFFLLIFILINYTDSDVPLWDSFTTSIFIIAMWLMARKKIEHWIAWIIGNSVSIPLYFYKGLIFTGFQYVVFLVLAVAGYIEWRKRLLILIPFFTLLSCKEECQYKPLSLAGVDFYSVVDGTVRQLAVDSLSIYGVGRQDSLLYKNRNNVLTVDLPVDGSYSESAFVFFFKKGDLSGRDTVRFNYEVIPLFISGECGFVLNFKLLSAMHTGSMIDSVVIVNKHITSFDDTNIRIYH